MGYRAVKIMDGCIEDQEYSTSSQAIPPKSNTPDLCVVLGRALMLISQETNLYSGCLLYCSALGIKGLLFRGVICLLIQSGYTSRS